MTARLPYLPRSMDRLVAAVAPGLVALLAATTVLAATAVPAVAGASQESVDERLRLQFSRSESAYRAGDVELALTLFDLLVEELAGDTASLDEEGRILLRRSLEYRVLLNWSEDRTRNVDADLDRLLGLDPTYVPDPDRFPDAVLTRHERARSRRVGYLRISVNPPHASVSIDGEPLVPFEELVALPAGEHRVSAYLPGHAPQSDEVRVRADRTEGVGFDLQRVSAVLRLATRPAGATVTLNGEAVGVTRPIATDPARPGEIDSDVSSRELVVEGLLPGTHHVVISLADHRTIRSDIEIGGLVDYTLDMVDLDTAVGTLLLRGVPDGSEILIDGESVSMLVDAALMGLPLGAAPFELPLGGHHVLVTHVEAGVFESNVGIGDGTTTTLDVRPRPGLAFLGVLGGDRLGVRSVRDSLMGGMATLDRWFLLEREDVGASILGNVGATAGALRELSAASEPSDGGRIRWPRLQRRAAESVPASLFVLAVLDRDRMADSVDLWLWAAPPAPARPAKWTLPINDDAATANFLDRLRDPLPAPEPWFGATFGDSDLAEGALVHDVFANGPAGRAGLRAGEEIVTANGQPVRDAAMLAATIAASAPFTTLSLQVRSDASTRLVSVVLDTSPMILAPSSADTPLPVLWAAIAAELENNATVTPRWVLLLDRAMLLMYSGDRDGALDTLRAIRAPEDLPLGQGAVNYYMGALLAAGSIDERAAAMDALRRAATATEARLGSHDGPRVAPRVRALLDALELNQSENR